MTFLEQLQSHRGGLIRLKTQLFWYGGRGWDVNPGRVCLLLDSVGTDASTTATTAAARRSASNAAVRPSTAAAAAHLLIDGTPHWVWVVEQDVELL
jgi:hypothetical protein